MCKYRKAFSSVAASLVFCAGIACAGVSQAAPAKNVTSNAKSEAPRQLAGDSQIHHALNRLGFGARPGDLERVRQIGLQRWIDQQLSPDTIEDKVVETKLSRLEHLQAPADRLMLAYLSDSANFIRQLRQAMEAKAKGEEPKRKAPDLKPGQQQLLDTIEKADIAPQQSMQALGELNVAKLTRAVESNRQLQEVMVDFWSNHFNVDVRKKAVRALKIVDDREAIRPHALGKFRDLLGASAKSPAMLIYLDNFQSTREFDRAAMGRRRMQNTNLPRRMGGGLNENYARELMELHTLGVDGGYHQKDVQEVARCLTGWSVRINQQNYVKGQGAFQFNAIAHDNGEKVVLGQKIPAGGGIRDGERVLDILAKHPSTAKFIARKLCVRFVADNPPQTLVDKVAQSFTASDGDLKQVMRTLINAPEFWSSEYYRGKIKSPFEYAVSGVRGLGGTIQVPNANQPRERMLLVASGGASVKENGGTMRRANGRTILAMQIADMGQPLWAHQTPDGYPEDSSAWVSAGALIARLNYALALTSGEIVDAQVTPATLLEGVSGDDAQAALDRLLQKLLGGQVSDGTRATLTKELPARGTPINPAKLCALILGSPEFQRR